MGNPGVGSLRVVRAALEAGKLEWEEYSHFGMISRLQAGATGLPFHSHESNRRRRPGTAQPQHPPGRRSLQREGSHRRPATAA